MFPCPYDLQETSDISNVLFSGSFEFIIKDDDISSYNIDELADVSLYQTNCFYLKNSIKV